MNTAKINSLYYSEYRAVVYMIVYLSFYLYKNYNKFINNVNKISR